MIINKISISPLKGYYTKPVAFKSSSATVIKKSGYDIFIPSSKINIHMFSDPDVQSALVFATKKHEGKFRKNPVKKIPYINHCINVGQKLQKAGFDKSTIIAGLLHDTVEDTNTTYDEIETKFGKKVSSLVKEVSHKKKNVSWEEKQNAYLDHIKNASVEAQAISAFDKIDNMNSSIECLKDGVNIYANMKETPQKQLEKWERLEKVYDESQLPLKIKEEYSSTLQRLYYLTDEWGLI